MPRKTKEQNILKDIDTNKTIEKSKKKQSKETTPAKKATNEKKKTSTTEKKADTKSTSKTSKTTTKKKATTSTAKKTTTKANSKVSKTTTRKKAATSATKKAASSRKNNTTKKDVIGTVEYYDLPYRYNQTVVKVLAQTPTNLFIYWDISDEDRKKFQEQYGKNFFETTKPILIVHNDTLNYSFEVEINDFANSWYLHVNDAKCNYRVELGRRPIIKNEKLNNNYIYISSSNEIESPNNHILFDRNQKMVYFRNIKTGEQTRKDITSLSFIRNMGKIYNISNLYKSLYKDENIEEIYDLSNPSSGNPSSGNFSSKFK